MEPVVILGGGLAGLSTGFFLRRPWLLVERSDRVGGLIKSEVIDGFSFDPTGHWLHLRDPEVRSLVTEKWLPGQLVSIQRKAAIYTRGVFTRFPYQVNQEGLPAQIIAENVIGFIEAQYGEKGRALRERLPTTFEEFILRHLGDGFARNFMVPYNQKLWTVHPAQLSAEWCGRFVPKPTLREVVEGALGLGADALGYNASFLYPKQGGIEAWAQAMAKSLSGGEILTGVEPLSIDWKNKLIHFSNGQRQSYSELVSTIALPRLVELLDKGAGMPAEVVQASRKLKATTVTYVNVGVRGPNRQPWHWVYLPEPEFKTYRIGSPSAVYSALAPPQMSSFYVEYSHRGELSLEACEAFARADLALAKMVRNEADILFAVAREIPHAYVLYDEDYGPAKNTLLDFLTRAEIETAGRYGRWEYSSMEDAVMGGRVCARRLNEKKPEG